MKRFLADREAAITVEFILWLPIIFLFWFAAVQVSLLFVAQSNYWSVARETARLVARRAVDVPTAETYAESEASLFGTSPTASVTVTGDVVNVSLSIPALSITALNPLNFTSDYMITASINHTMEPW